MAALKPTRNRPGSSEPEGNATALPGNFRKQLCSKAALAALAGVPNWAALKTAVTDGR